VLAGIILSSVYRGATERAFDRRLNLYLRTLVAEVASPTDAADPQATPTLGEPLFELPLSGWYWEIAPTDGDKAELLIVLRQMVEAFGCVQAVAEQAHLNPT
jgi:hypothetical protein